MMRTFKQWFSENKDSEQLQEGYLNHLLEMKQCGLKADSFKVWARQVYEAIREQA